METAVNLNELHQMLQADYDEDAHWDKYREPIEDIFKSAITLDGTKNPDLYSCGSYKPSDTCKCLYRILWLCKPLSVSFEDMYKKSLFAFYSADQRFAVSVELYKYELGLYFYAPKSAIDTSGISNIVTGMPGADNGQVLTDEDGNRFFEIVKLAIEREWCVYGGNNFDV